MATNDSFSIRVYQNSGSNLTLGAAGAAGGTLGGNYIAITKVL